MTELIGLKSKRVPIKAALTRFKNFFAEHDRSSGVGSLPARLQNFETLYEKYDTVQTAIEQLVINDEITSEAQAENREEFENTYFDVLTQAREFIEQCKVDSAIRIQNNQSDTSSRNETPVFVSNHSSIDSLSVKLPTITLPKFDGSFKDWLPFRDTFKSLIHENSRLSNIQKFHYLNSALAGDSARVIQSLGVSDSNYKLAWQGLIDRYEDSLSLIHYHTKSVFDLNPITKPSYVSLRQLIDDTSNHLLALKSLGEQTDTWDTMIIYLLTTKLDQFTKREWEKHLSSISRKPALKDLMTFLENHCKYLQRTTVEKQDTNSTSNNNSKKHSYSKGAKSQSSERFTSHATTKKTCPLCNDSHALYNCDKLRELPIPSRIQEASRLRVCFNCLSPGHRNKQCTLGPCSKCPGKHNTLLHLERNTKDTAECEEPNSKQNSEFAAKASLITNSNDSDHVMLGTAIVWIKDQQGNRHECRALLDSCSQVNLITRELCQRLKLPVSDSDTIISGVGKTTQEPRHRINTTIQSTSTAFTAHITCFVTPEITDDMPNIPLRRKDFDIPEGIKLADPYFAKTRSVDLLISAGLFWKLLCVGQIQLREDQPIIQKTQLGWIVAGPMELPSSKVKRKLSCNLITNQQLHDDVARFWEIENIFSRKPYPNLDSHNDCEQHFQATTERDHEGRFVVSLPLKSEVSELGNSLGIAQKRLISIERKLSKQPVLKKGYIEFMDDYEAQGHMEKIPPEQINSHGPIFYLPHHAVFKENSTTTKIRVVFDGSAKTSSGLSLNEVQSVGPVVQSELFSILLRFRQHRIVLSADITQMYRQIKITQDQQDLQRILWRRDPSQEIQHFRLTTVTYGTASAPFLATRTLRQIGEENKREFPITSDVIIRDFYVDDLATGVDSVKEAKQLKKELNQLLNSAGLELRKWACNDPRVLLNDQHAPSEKLIKGDKDPKLLGLLWNSALDTLRYSVQETPLKRITKRTILSKAAQIFDPLGLVGPVVVRAKIIIQKLWELQIDWDEALPQNLHTIWNNFSNQLINLNEISVRRWVLCDNPVTIQLHGFSDASEAAYGACIYLRTTDQCGNHTVYLLCAKSRVAPLKKISLPRLELQAALVLAQLVESISTALTLEIDETYFWTDSTITLYWIQSSPSRWKTYIANRTSEIQNLTNNNWHHVVSQDNPADVISRGINPEDLRDCKLWWNGPSWLSQNSNLWPPQRTLNVKDAPEERKCERVLVVTSELDFSLLKRYSSFTRAIRVTAYCLRFYRNLSVAKANRKLGTLELEELSRARTCLLKLAQVQDFSSEIREIREIGQISKNSNLLSLSPFIDTEGLLRVGGRLANAPVPYDQKHPIILSANNPLTLLIISHEHVRLLHAGCQAVIASLRTQYWPIACKNTVKGVLRKCVTCFKIKPIGTEYIMANLPSARVTPQRPFYTSGVDYAGPYYLIDRPRSRIKIKAYMCIFVCFTTKAVHIELARDLSTDAFLNCMRRFTSRRGLCKHLHSDNGTNFVGARNELNELKALLSDSEFQKNVHDFLANQQISWHMIPPSAPHFGGLWEAAVKSAKKHVYRVVGETSLTYEELYTLLTQVEACLNSRPLSPISNDPNDLTPLTPGHFLIGESLTAIPEPDLRDLSKNRLNRYQHLQQMTQHFWQRWQREYLNQLQQRHKWAQPVANRLVPGTMVVVRDNDLSPLKWLLGRITEVHPGKDNVIRTVSVRLAKSIVKRPVAKICILPFE